MSFHAASAPLVGVSSGSASDPESSVSVHDEGRSNSVELPHGGGLDPVSAWALVQAGKVTLVDVRTAEERKFVGHVPDSVHVPWATGTALTRNPRFTRELEAKLGGKDTPTLLICRSGKRSAQAVEAAIKAGFNKIANVHEGFEGDLDARHQRGHENGWRFHGLPWKQD